MTGDIEVPTSHTLAAASPDERTPEARATRTIIKSVAVAVPVAIVLMVGLVALAVHNQQPDWNAWIAMAAGIGVIAGVFFGLLLGFMLSSHVLDG
jgi:hypothetical protein